jgi:hypothetical protein
VINLKRLVCAIAFISLIITPLQGLSFYEAPYGLRFAAGASIEAGAISLLEFTIPGADGLRYVEIDLGTSGFVPLDSATWQLDGWPERTPVRAQSTINGTRISVLANQAPRDAFSHYLLVPVRNPDFAGRLPIEGIAVRTGRSETQNALVPGMTRHLDIRYRVTSSVEQGIVGDSADVTFRVFDGPSLSTDPIAYTLKWNTRVMTRGFLTTGETTLPVPFMMEPGKPSTSFIFEVTKATDQYAKGTISIPIRYKLNVSPLEGFSYLDTATIFGTITDSTGRGIAGETVSIVNKAALFMPAATMRTDAEGKFSLQSTFLDAGEHVLRIGNTEYKNFAVQGLGLDVIMDRQVANSTSGVRLPLRIMYDEQDLTKQAEVRVLDPDGEVLLDWAGGQQARLEGDMRIITLGANLPLGNYLLEARWEDTEQADTPNHPDRFARVPFVMRASAASAQAAETRDDLVSAGPNKITVTVRDARGTGLKQEPKADEIKRVEFTVRGAVARPVSFDSDIDEGFTNDSTTVMVEVTGAGDVLVEGTVTLGNGAVEPFSFALAAGGWVVRTSQIIGMMGNVVTLRALVTTPAGTPVNNAQVSWTSPRMSFETIRESGGQWTGTTSSVVIDGLASNVQDGIYEQTVRLGHPSDRILLQVRTGQDNAIMAHTCVELRDAAFYQLKVEPRSLIATLDNQPFEISYLSPRGDTIAGSAQLVVEGSGGERQLTTWLDTDRFFLSLSPNTTGQITVGPGEQDASRFNTLQVPVLTPNIVTGLRDKVTENIYHHVDMVSRDPYEAGQARPFAVRFTGRDVHMRLETGSGLHSFTSGVSLNQSHTSHMADRHSFRLLAWRGAGVEDKGRVVIEVSYNGKDWVTLQTLSVEPLQVIPSVPALYVGESNPLTLTVLHANGEPLTGRTVIAGDSHTSNAEGQVALTLRPTGTALFPIAVVADREVAGNKLKRTVYIDAQFRPAPPPTPPLPPPPGPQEPIVIPVGRAMPSIGLDVAPQIRNGRLMVPLRWFGEYVLNLPTENIQFAPVAGIDSVVLRGKSEMILPINSLTANVNGRIVRLDAPAYISSGRTLVPARFLAETFGYTVSWDAVRNVVIIE